MKKILFIDRDGTLVEEPHDYQVDELSKIRLMPHVIPSLLSLTQEGFTLVMVSNQDGLGTTRFPQASFQECHDFILELFTSQGILFEKIFICPHLPEEGCSCRKPKTGLLDAFFENKEIDFNHSYVIGDRDTDRLLAENLDITFLPISRDHGWQKITQKILQSKNLYSHSTETANNSVAPVLAPSSTLSTLPRCAPLTPCSSSVSATLNTGSKRSASITRKTNETDITVTLVLDTEEPSRINTPIGFFTHMLEQIAKHAGLYLDLQAEGDVEVDQHHLIEDTAITLGEALKKALGDKAGIQRYGFTLPMDEALATIAIDIGGRGSSHFEGRFTRDFVGGLATEMIPHFFHSFATSLGATIHVQVKGTNNHHIIEACFKALGRALRQATTKHGIALPSTKGVL